MAASAKTTKTIKKVAEDDIQKNENSRNYAITESYKKGEVIYHKTWDDYGEVIEVGNTDDGISKMKVAFEKVGLKNLRMS
jgi:ClpP class serine protease